MLVGLPSGFDLNQHIVVQRISGIVDDGLDIVNRQFLVASPLSLGTVLLTPLRCADGTLAACCAVTTRRRCPR